MHRTLFKNNIAPRGFTLIELLVVIAIIGVLSSVVLTSLNIARYRGYDATRWSDLRQMQTILDNYYSDYGAYPYVVSGKWYSVCGSPFTPVAQNSVVANGGTTLVSLGYISQIPVGPLMNTSSLSDCYAYRSNGTDFKFMDYNPVNSNFSNHSEAVLNDPARQNTAWAVYTAGAANW